MNSADVLNCTLVDITDNEIANSHINDPAEQLYGPPIIDLSTDKYEKYEINQKYFSGKYAMQELIIFDVTMKQFFQYKSDTGLWKWQSDLSISHRLGQFFQQVILLLRPELLSKRTGSLLRSMVEMLKGIVERDNAFTKTICFIHVANGVLEIDQQTGECELKPFSPDYFSRNRSEVMWLPDAKCHRFIKELLESALSAEDIEIIQKYLGQCLLGKNISQRILILRGTAGGGKSTLVEIIEKIIGIFNVAELRVQHLGQRFELIRFVGKTLLTGKDVPSNFLDSSPAHTIKKLTGNDLIEGEAKGANQSFQLRGDFNVIITSNSNLKVKLDSDIAAWRRRLILVDYDKQKPEKTIPNFADLLISEEGPGILKWGIDGAIKLLNDVQSGGIVLTEIQQKRIDDLLFESDSVFSFVENCVTKASHSDVTTAELQVGYQIYCENRGWEPMPARRFLLELPDAMLTVYCSVKRTDIKRDGKNQRGFAGVAFSSAYISGKTI